MLLSSTDIFYSFVRCPTHGGRLPLPLGEGKGEAQRRTGHGEWPSRAWVLSPSQHLGRLSGPVVPTVANGGRSTPSASKCLRTFPARLAQTVSCHAGCHLCPVLFRVPLLLVHWNSRKSTSLRREPSDPGLTWPLPTLLTLSVGWPPAPLHSSPTSPKNSYAQPYAHRPCSRDLKQSSTKPGPQREMVQGASGFHALQLCSAWICAIKD